MNVGTHRWQEVGMGGHRGQDALTGGELHTVHLLPDPMSWAVCAHVTGMSVSHGGLRAPVCN